MQIRLEKNKKYLLACSYGPDSMALLWMLKEGNYNFSLAHVNYGLRGEESDKETEDLIRFCVLNNIDIYEKRVEGKSIKGNFQNEARKIRYNFFENVAVEEGFDALLTAHHADDVIETYLMQQNSKRETFYYGIRAEIKLNNLFVVRPLLNYFKDDLVAFCQQNHVPFAIDSSNLALNYTRNKVRHNIVKKMTIQEKNDLLLVINKKNKELSVLTKKLENLIDNNVVLIDEFKKLNDNEQQHLLYLLFLKQGIAEKFSKGRKNQILDIIYSDKNSSFIKIVDSFSAVKYEGKIALINMDDYAPYKFVIETPKTIKTVHFSAYFGKNGMLPVINEENYPLTIATKGKGQTYKIKDYEKTINRLFIDMKLPRHYRLIWPIVTNKNSEVIYVPRYRQNYKSKETDLFKIFIK